MVQPISGHTALVGVLGDPVRHSLSPAMHNAALAALKLDWVYLALPTPPQQLASVVQALAAIDCRGLNVTIPHKQAVASLCQERTALAERLGAVNTLVPRGDGSWLGTNTDVEGFLAPLRQRDPAAWPDCQAVVLGCGGSARAVVAGLVELGVGRIMVAARRPEALRSFHSSCNSWAPQLQPLTWDALSVHLDELDLLVNTTPVGMASGSDPDAARRCPLLPKQVDRLPPDSTVYDLIYTPRPTALLRAATERGCQTVDGLEMLVQQGAAALRIWTGLAEVPVAAMRSAAMRALES